MTQAEFMEWAKDTVREYTEEHTGVTDKAQLDDIEVFIVWYCKTLQNHKAILISCLRDGMIYEFTYNGDKDEAYLDAYRKITNEVKKHE